MTNRTTAPTMTLEPSGLPRDVVVEVAAWQAVLALDPVVRRLTQDESQQLVAILTMQQRDGDGAVRFVVDVPGAGRVRLVAERDERGVVTVKLAQG